MEDVVAWLNQINRPGRHLKRFVLLAHFVQLGVKLKFIQLHTMGLLPEFCTILFRQLGLESKIMLCDFSIRSGVYSTCHSTYYALYIFRLLSTLSHIFPGERLTVKLFAREDDWPNKWCWLEIVEQSMPMHPPHLCICICICLWTTCKKLSSVNFSFPSKSCSGKSCTTALLVKRVNGAWKVDKSRHFFSI